MSLLNKPKSEMTPEELQKREEEEFNTGPLSVLTQSVKNNTQVLINYRWQVGACSLLSKLTPRPAKTRLLSREQ
uniref:Small nuclear ribonucleoprotein Sm D2 n=1 Tax=Myotis myotis TaxID=51298 RepID=A0A7J7R9M7_MYOMY|nr:small nuclear ribonucleoprotein D2 polypeptide [Myotis myotis]